MGRLGRPPTAVALASCLLVVGISLQCPAQDWLSRPPPVEAAQQKATAAAAADVGPWKELAAIALQYQYAELAAQAAGRIRRIQPADLDARYYQGLARLRVVIDRENKKAGYEDGLATLSALPSEYQQQRKVLPILRAVRAAIAAEESIGKALEEGTSAGFQEAARLLETALKDDPENLVYRETLAWLYLEKMHAPDRAYSHARLAAERLPGAEDLLRKVDAYKMFAFVAAETGRFDEAIVILERLVQWDPNDPSTRLQLAKASIAAGRFERGLALFQQLSASDAGNEEAQQALEKYLGPSPLPDVQRPAFFAALDRGMQHLRDAEQTRDLATYMLAADSLRAASEIHPGSHFARLTLGWIYLEKINDPRAALRQLESAVQLQPNEASGHALLGMAYYRLGEFGQAIDVLRAAIERNPNDLWLQVNLAMALARVDCFGEAFNRYEDVLDRAAFGSKEHAMARLGIAEIRAWEGETRPPLREALDLVAQDPQFAEAWLLVGDLHHWSWDLTSAEDAYQRVLAIDPHNGEARQGLHDIAMLRSRTPSFDAYNFTDNFDFSRTNFQAALRFPLSDRSYLTAAFDEWEFAQQANYSRRSEARLALEHYATRTLSFNASYGNYDYPDFALEHAWSIGGRLSPVNLPSVSFSYSDNDAAYLDSINIPLLNIRMDSLACGVDIPLDDAISLQGEYIESFYSDENRRRFISGQVSHQICPESEYCYLRLRVDSLSYKEQTPVYFSPDEYLLVRPMLDCSHRITDWLALTLRLEVPYVRQETGGWGYTALIGPDIRLGDRMSLRAHYLKTSLPTENPFSGDVIAVHAEARF